MMIAYQLWVFSVMIALGHCRPKLDRVEERNEELSGPDVTFDYHNPPNSDVLAREEETEEGAHRLSKRLAEPPPQQKLVYLDSIYLVDDKTYSSLVKTSQSQSQSQSKSLEEEEEEQYADNNEDDLDLAAAIVYRPLFAYRLQKSRRLARRRNPRSIHSTLPIGSKTKLLYRTDNDLTSKVIIVFLPVYTHKSQLEFDDDDDARAARSATTSITASQEDHPKHQNEEKEEGQYYQQNGEILIAQPSDSIVLDDGDPLEPAESSVVHPLFLYKYRVAYYKKKELKEEKKKKRRQ